MSSECAIEVVSPKHLGSMSSWPETLIHWTDNPKDADQIARRGFNLKYCGRTAKKYHAEERLWKYDPCGVYALEYFDGVEDSGGFRPYIVFSADISRALYIKAKSRDVASSCGKREISEEYGGKTGMALTKALLKDGIEAIFTEIEMIILDPRLISIENLSGMPFDEMPFDE